MAETVFEMEKSIRRQPEEVHRILNQQPEIFRGAGEAIRRSRRLFIVGTGSSLHSGLFGRYFFSTYSSQHSVFVYSSFEFANYVDGLEKDDAVIVISHRGYKRYSYLSLLKARKEGCTVIAITGNGTTIKESDANFVFHTVEQEKSSAHTVSLTTSMAVMLALSIYASGKKHQEIAQELRRIGDSLKNAMESAIGNTFVSAEKFIEIFKGSDILWISGTGPNAIAAIEGSLKFQETSYITAFGYELEQLIHGPIRSSNLKSDTFLFVCLGRSQERTEELANVLNSMKVHLFMISDHENRDIPGITLRDSIGEVLSPFQILCVLQILALKVSIKLGTNPDTFRSGEKEFKAIDDSLKL